MEGSWSPHPQPWCQSYSAGPIILRSPRRWVFCSFHILGLRRYPMGCGWPAHPTLLLWPQAPQESFCRSAEGRRTFPKTRVVTDRPSCLTCVGGPWGMLGAFTLTQGPILQPPPPAQAFTMDQGTYPFLIFTSSSLKAQPSGEVLGHLDPGL